MSAPGIADETVRLGFSHRGPVAITRETIRPDFVPVERRGRIRHEVIYVRETETQLWYFTDLLISGTPCAAGKDRTKEGSQSWRIEAEVHSRDASPVDRLDAALTAVAEVIGDPQDSRRSFVVTAKDGEEPEVKEMTD